MGFDNLLIHSATIQELVATQDEYGEQIESWVDKETGVACRLDQASGDEFRVLKETYTKATHVLYLRPRDYDIDPERHRIITEGQTFTIDYVSKGGGTTHHLEILLEIIHV